MSLLVLHNILPQNLISLNNNFILLQVSRMAQWAILAWGLSCSCSQILTGSADLQNGSLPWFGVDTDCLLWAHLQLSVRKYGLPSLTTSGQSDFSHNGNITRTCSEVTDYNFCCFLLATNKLLNSLRREKLHLFMCIMSRNLQICFTTFTSILGIYI